MDRNSVAEIVQNTLVLDWHGAAACDRRAVKVHTPPEDPNTGHLQGLPASEADLPVEFKFLRPAAILAASAKPWSRTCCLGSDGGTPRTTPLRVSTRRRMALAPATGQLWFGASRWGGRAAGGDGSPAPMKTMCGVGATVGEARRAGGDDGTARKQYGASPGCGAEPRLGGLRGRRAVAQVGAAEALPAEPVRPRARDGRRVGCGWCRSCAMFCCSCAVLSAPSSAVAPVRGGSGVCSSPVPFGALPVSGAVGITRIALTPALLLPSIHRRRIAAPSMAVHGVYSVHVPVARICSPAIGDGAPEA